MNFDGHGHIIRNCWTNISCWTSCLHWRRLLAILSASRIVVLSISKLCQPAFSFHLLQRLVLGIEFLELKDSLLSSVDFLFPPRPPQIEKPARQPLLAEYPLFSFWRDFPLDMIWWQLYIFLTHDLNFNPSFERGFRFERSVGFKSDEFQYL